MTERPNANSINSKEKGRNAFKIDPGLFECEQIFSSKEKTYDLVDDEADMTFALEEGPPGRNKRD